MQNTRKMPQFWPRNCFSRWEFWDTFRNCLSTKCAAREKCCSLGRKIVFRVGNFQTLFESFCQRNAKHKTNVTVWSGKLFSTLVISRHFPKVFISGIRNARKMSQFGSKNWFPRWKFPVTFRKILSVKCKTREKCHSLDQKFDFRVGNFQPLFESFYQWNAKREKNVTVWIKKWIFALEISDTSRKHPPDLR